MSKIFTDKMAEVYKEQIKDNKDVIVNNTKAVIEHSNVVEENTEISKELKTTIAQTSREQITMLQEMRIWLKENFSKPGR